MGFVRNALYVSFPLFLAWFFFSGPKFDPASIRGKRVLVTGASSGIGEGVAYEYAELGAKLVLTARRSDLLSKVAKKCLELGAQAVFPIPADMAEAGDRLKVVRGVEQHLGGLDFLILNHALMHFGVWKNSAENMTLLERMTNINFLSFVDISSKLTSALEKSKGHIGVVTSIAGKMGALGIAHYCSSKHALHGFYTSLRQELRKRDSGVSVTLVVYGPVNSEKAMEIGKDLKSKYDIMSMAGSVEGAAEVLLKGVSERRYEVYYPTVSTISVYLSRFFPHFMEDLASENFIV